MPLPYPATDAHRAGRARTGVRLALTLTLAASACGRHWHSGVRAAVPDDPPAALVLHACTVPGLDEAARCGVDSVWENRETRRGRRIGLRVVVLPAQDASPAPDPFVVLAGGPGQGAAELAPALARELAPLRQRRDLLLVDQRGTGASNRLACTGGMAAVMDTTGTAARACAAELAARADVRQYTTAAAVDDLDEVRATLGYARVNLLGVSYGSRVAQLYARRHPDRVRTVTLRAVAPLGFNIPRDGARAADAALHALFGACAADRACAAAFPRPAADLDTVLARATRAPARVRVARPGPPGGGPVDSADVTLDRPLVAQTLYALLLSAPSRQAIPLLLHRAALGAPRGLATVAAQVQAAVYDALPAGMYLSVVCGEDAPALTAADQGTLARTFAGLSAGIVAACRAWPRNAPPAYDRPKAAPAAGTAPALLVSGEADPATDVAHGAALARAWPGARHLVLPATAHGPMFPGCARDLVATFVERASSAGLDAGCTRALTWPPFVTGP